MRLIPSLAFLLKNGFSPRKSIFEERCIDIDKIAIRNDNLEMFVPSLNEV